MGCCCERYSSSKYKIQPEHEPSTRSKSKSRQLGRLGKSQYLVTRTHDAVSALTLLHSAFQSHLPEKALRKSLKGQIHRHQIIHVLIDCGIEVKDLGAERLVNVFKLPNLDSKKTIKWESFAPRAIDQFFVSPHDTKGAKPQFDEIVKGAKTIRKAFDVMDLDHNDSVSWDEMRVAPIFEKISDKELRKIFKNMKSDDSKSDVQFHKEREEENHGQTKSFRVQSVGCSSVLGLFQYFSESASGEMSTHKWMVYIRWDDALI
eukprot:224637_1